MELKMDLDVYTSGPTGLPTKEKSTIYNLQSTIYNLQRTDLGEVSVLSAQAESTSSADWMLWSCHVEADLQPNIPDTLTQAHTLRHLMTYLNL